MSESGSTIDLADLSSLLAGLQAQFRDLPAGITLTISVGAPPPPSAPVSSPSTPPEDEMRLWYSPKELAALHAVRPATVQKWVREGRFPGASRLPNGAIRIPKAEAELVLLSVEAPESARIASPADQPQRSAVHHKPTAPRASTTTPTFSSWRGTHRKAV